MKTLDLTKKIIATSVGLVMATSSFSVLSEDVLVVTANRMQQNINDTLADVEIIERADIEKIQPQSLADLLINIAGADVIHKGGHSQDTSVHIRGAGSSQTLILIDGIRVGSATLGGKSVSNISVSQIEKIEIVKGARAAIWGADAIGGVIQIFTRRYESEAHRIAITYGSNSTKEIDASLGFGTKKFSNTVTLSHKETDGFDVVAPVLINEVLVNAEPDDDGSDNDSVAIRGDYTFSKGSILDWVAQVDEGFNEYDPKYGGDNISNYNNHHWNLRYSHQSEDWNNQFSVRSSRDSSYSERMGDVNDDFTIFETRREQATYLTRKELSDTLSIGAGFEHLSDNIEKSSLGYDNSKRTTKSSHLNANYIGEKFVADLAFRKDNVEAVSNELTVNFGVGFKLKKGHLVSLNFGEGFKAPSFNDLYYPGSGNANLKFETSENAELVYKGIYANKTLVVSWFDSEITNLIEWAPAPTADNPYRWLPFNVGVADISGLEATYKIQQADVSHKFTTSYLTSEDGTTGRRLLRRAKEQFGYELTFSGDSVEFFAQLKYVGYRPDTTVDLATFKTIAVELDSYVQTNIGASFRLNNHWEVKLKVNDLFKESPVRAYGYSPIEQEIYLTISHQNLF